MKQTLQTSIWSCRDIRLVLPARALSYAGDSIALIALMLRVSDGHGPAAVTALLLAFAVPTVLMIPFAGRIVDGFDSRKVLVWSGLLQVVAGVGLAFVHDLVNTLALVCVLQIGQAVAGPAWGALIPRIVGEELVGRTTGTSQALIGVATLAGSAAGGLLVGWVGSRGALLVDAATFLALVVVAQLVRTRRRPEPGAARERGGVSAGLRAIFGDDILKILVPALWMFVVVGEAVNVVEVFLITGELGLGPALYGAAGAATGAGAIFGAWYSGRLNGDRARAVGSRRGNSHDRRVERADGSGGQPRDAADRRRHDRRRQRVAERGDERTGGDQVRRGRPRPGDRGPERHGPLVQHPRDAAGRSGGCAARSARDVRDLWSGVHGGRRDRRRPGRPEQGRIKGFGARGHQSLAFGA